MSRLSAAWGSLLGAAGILLAGLAVLALAVWPRPAQGYIPVAVHAGRQADYSADVVAPRPPLVWRIVAEVMYAEAAATAAAAGLPERLSTLENSLLTPVPTVTLSPSPRRPDPTVSAADSGVPSATPAGWPPATDTPAWPGSESMATLVPGLATSTPRATASARPAGNLTSTPLSSATVTNSPDSKRTPTPSATATRPPGSLRTATPTPPPTKTSVPKPTATWSHTPASNKPTHTPPPAPTKTPPRADEPTKTPARVSDTPAASPPTEEPPPATATSPGGNGAPPTPKTNIATPLPPPGNILSPTWPVGRPTAKSGNGSPDV